MKHLIPFDMKLVQALQSPLLALRALAEAEQELSSESRRKMADAIAKIEKVAGGIEAKKSSSPAASAEAGEDSLAAFAAAPVPWNELHARIRAIFERKQADYAPLRRVTFAWTKPQSLEIPVEVSANLGEFERVVGSLIDQAVASLGGSQGVVRVGLRIGLRAVELSIEDNGRGMSEDLFLIARRKGMLVEEGPRVDLAYTRRLMRSWGGRAERLARLGVGARVIVELPRVDAFARVTPVARAADAAHAGF